MKQPILAMALITLAALALTASTKEVVLTGRSHMEFNCPSNAQLRLHVRSGAIMIVGADDDKITVDLAGKNVDKIQDVKGRLSVANRVAELHLTGGPRNELQIIIHVPRNSDLMARGVVGG